MVNEDGKTAYIECSRNVVIRSLYAITSFAIWLRFLYFFRVFKSTGYYIRMIVEVIIDMGQFFLIFSISVIAFA